jgi:hypothetical protein
MGNSGGTAEIRYASGGYGDSQEDEVYEIEIEIEVRIVFDN